MKKLIISKKYEVLLDDEDFERINSFRWYIRHMKSKYKEYFYAVRSINIDNKCKWVLMHREVMHPKDNEIVDHKDFNGLNNQKSNLRICSKSQNAQNSRYNRKLNLPKGVTAGMVVSSSGKKYYFFKAQIVVNNKAIYLGNFKTVLEAQLAYNKTAEEYHKDFRHTSLYNPKKYKMTAEEYYNSIEHKSRIH